MSEIPRNIAFGKSIAVYAVIAYCILHNTGGICPIIRCTTSILKGPCGGSQNGVCEIHQNIKCGWQMIYDRLKRLNKLELLAEVPCPARCGPPPKDWSQSRQGGKESEQGGFVIDKAIIAAAKLKTESELEKLFTAGRFVLTSELGPPKSCLGQGITQAVSELKDYCDGFNLTENQTAIVRLSSIVAGVHVIAGGGEPVIQMSCRDRNRIAIQSDLFGAYSTACGKQECSLLELRPPGFW